MEDGANEEDVEVVLGPTGEPTAVVVELAVVEELPEELLADEVVLPVDTVAGDEEEVVL